MVTVERCHREGAAPPSGAEPTDHRKYVDAAVDESEVPLDASAEAHASVEGLRHQKDLVRSSTFSLEDLPLAELLPFRCQ